MKTTSKHFDYFVKECKKALNDFGITDWDVTYLQVDIDEMAATTFRIPSKTATVCLASEWKHNSITQDDLKITAWHEASHFVMARLFLIGNARFCSDSELIEADEEATNTIVNFLRKIKHI